MPINKDQLLYMDVKPVGNSHFACMLMRVRTRLCLHATDPASVSAEARGELFEKT